MTTSLEDFVIAHPQVTLSHTVYGQHFYLGHGVNILSSPAQRLQAFVEDEGSPYRFILVGQLTSFKVVEDSVRQGRSCETCLFCIQSGLQFRHFLTVNLGQLPSPSVFSDIFEGQLATLQKIEEDDATRDNVHDQVCFIFIFNF
jgi:hypothetical protein